MPDTTPDTPTQMKIFVSHSHKDQIACQALVDALRSAGADEWYDERNTSASSGGGPSLWSSSRPPP
jgi:predicted esterase